MKSKDISSLVVLENDLWFWKVFEDFLKTIAPKWSVFNPEVSDLWYLNNTALWLSMTIAQPQVTDVAMQTSFESSTGVRYDKDASFSDLNTQFEILLPVIREALRFRENNGLPKLTFHVVYNSDTDFINDVKEGRLGENAWGDLSLMLRQQSNLAIKLYNHKNHSLIKTIQSTVEF